MSGRFSRPTATRKLPAQPSLEQLRKQAKELLEGYRAGDAAAIDEVRRFERQPPPEAELALHDAQRVLARAYGFQSWAKLKAFVDGANVARLAEAAGAGDLDEVRRLIAARPELVGMDLSGGDERRALHFAVSRRDVRMVRLLMEAGADARQGVFPHRDATSPLAIARDRGYEEIVAAIEEEERARVARQASCTNVTISPEQERVCAAILRGDAEAARATIESDVSLLNACGRDGGTPLHAAARAGDAAMVEWLLARGAHANKRDQREFSPLDRAALAVEGFAEIAALLLRHRADVTIHGAVALGDAAAVHQWVRGGGDIRAQTASDGGLLTLAVKHEQAEMVRLLLELGADVDERILLENVEEPTPSWGYPLWWAALQGRFEIAKLLLDSGADPNANVYASGWPLWNAWREGHREVAQLLLERGARRQPYMVVQQHDVEEARRLLDADRSEELARELTWSAADVGCAPILEMALERVGHAGDERWWHWVLIQPIRGAGADSEQNAGHFACMEALLRHGVDPNVTRFGQSVLHFAAAYHGPVGGADRARFAAMLLDAGARVEIRDELLRSTPLGWACRWGRMELAELLLARGARAEEPDAEPWASPSAWARKMGHTALLRLLANTKL